jgi:hypothetical protein
MKTIHSKLNDIQISLKAPKGQFNKFGKYKYRSAEDILESIKPYLSKHNLTLTISEETKELAGILFITSRAVIQDENGETYSVEAQAGVNPERKGMDIAQSFGSSSSYAKKYALGNLFLLDDTKDADTNRVNEPIAKKEKLDEVKFKAMLKALEEGKAEAVKEKLPNYILSKSQEGIINQLIK